MLRCAVSRCPLSLFMYVSHKRQAAGGFVLTVGVIHARKPDPCYVLSLTNEYVFSDFMLSGSPEVPNRSSHPQSHNAKRTNSAWRSLSHTGEYFTGAIDEMIACYVKGVSNRNRITRLSPNSVIFTKTTAG